jgi:hypothetical protein
MKQLLAFVRRPVAARIFSCALWLAVGVNLLSGVRGSWAHSQDFQWMPSRLMWQGVNPYEVYLGGHRDQLILEQIPNYGHFIYVILLPYAMLPWAYAKVAWLLTNVMMLVGFVIKARRQLTGVQSRALWSWAVLLMCLGYPIKNVLANGQQGILCLFGLGLCFIYRRRPWLAGFGLALIVSKYSFGVFVATVMLAAGFTSVVGVAALLSAGAWLFVSFWTGTDPWVCLFEPLQVASRAVPLGFADLMSVFRILQGHAGGALGFGYGVIAVVYAIFCAMLWRQRHLLATDSTALARALGGSVMVSLGTVFHLGYDQTVGLFFVWALLLGGRGRVDAVFLPLLLSMFGFFWLLPRFGKYMPVDPFVDYRVMALLAVALIACGFVFGLMNVESRSNVPRKRTQMLSGRGELNDEMVGRP